MPHLVLTPTDIPYIAAAAVFGAGNIVFCIFAANLHCRAKTDKRMRFERNREDISGEKNLHNSCGTSVRKHYSL